MLRKKPAKGVLPHHLLHNHVMVLEEVVGVDLLGEARLVACVEAQTRGGLGVIVAGGVDEVEGDLSTFIKVHLHFLYCALVRTNIMLFLKEVFDTTFLLEVDLSIKLK